MHNHPATPDTKPHYIYSGSSVSGPGYGYGIYRTEDRSQWAVLLGWAGLSRMVPCASFDAACELGENFADIGRVWHVITSRRLALAQGFAVLG